MSTGFRTSGGVDLDSIFAQYTSGTKAGLTGVRVSSGQDLRDRYQPYTSGTKAALTGFRNASGVDMRDLFQKIGSGGVLPDPGYAQMRRSYVMTGGATYNVDTRLTLNSDGTWQVLNFDTDNPGIPQTGDWFEPSASGVGSPYQVMFAWTLTSGTAPTISNGASTWTALSTGRAFSAVLSSTAAVPKNCTGNLRVQIRRASDGVVLSDITNAVSLALQQL